MCYIKYWNIKGKEPNLKIAYSLYLYFLGLSYRSTANALDRLIHRSHVLIQKWIQRYKLQKVSSKRKRIKAFIIDETPLRIGFKLHVDWVAIDSKAEEILGISISHERNMLIAERLISSLINNDGCILFPQLEVHGIHKHADY